jgi:glucose-1-phosphate cytidylyltransferase
MPTWELTVDLAEIPVFVLCGGIGTRIKEETEFKPKPMVPIGDHPILWHILKYYNSFGFRKFVLCTGFKSEVIKSYFINYASMNSDFSVNLKTNDVVVHSIDHNEDWEVTVAYTGEKNMTGSRIKQAISKYLNGASDFAVTYGDGLSNADLRSEFSFHQQGKIGTVLGVNAQSRFGELVVEDNKVQRFAEKPAFSNSWINGGYFFFKAAFASYLSDAPDCVLEQQPLTQLAADGQLQIFKHQGFWACMDTQRDRDQLNALWNSGDAPWRTIAS